MALEVELDPEFERALSDLAERENLSREEVVRKAVFARRDRMLREGRL